MSGHAAIISPAMRRYMLIILMVSYAINIVDRQILAILIVPIKAELGLSDTSIGFLTGFAFAIFYATAGLPIALLADRYNRTKLIAAALTLWSGMTALSGFAQNFAHLALARIGVGVGEAGGSPPAHSIIADLYKPEKRSTALAIYGLGIPIGTLIGLGLGGWISQHYGWRVALFAVGAPGLVLAGVIALTFREPPRPPIPANTRGDKAPSLIYAIKHMANTPVIVHIAIGGSLITAFGAALVAWTPTYLARTHGMELQTIGLYLGLVAGIPGAVGMFLGGALADRFGARRAGWYLWTVAAALALMTPSAAASFLAPTAAWSLALFVAPFTFGVFFYQAASFAQVQNHVDGRMRAMAAAIMLFVFNLFGQGAGPQIVGFASDALAGALGDQALKAALSGFSIVAVWAAAHYFRAGQLLERPRPAAIDEIT